MIKVKPLDNNKFEVEVTSRSTTTHVVTVQPEYARKLARQDEDTVSLVMRSFEFLLARESNTSILRSFDLSVIARYFPEYESEIQR
ncbi:hypothetical protein [Methylovorus sp. MP688]|jgi:hypothetical protein|uniref:hypothetical protein n=1 Tax=Methylovorus sp. (strain MP688) TaxID=887061 RepID=UPI0001EC47EE|nr:hypothetical protein [Methylovorus sp. MP688]ADQ84928.1 conserved hypothetical protein [Methylovorus sp. MP688]